MIDSVKQLQDLLTWAKKEGIKSLQVGDIKAEFSELAIGLQLAPGEFNSDLSDKKPSKEETSKSTKTLLDDAELTPEEQEDLLFHSSRP